jgi:hypothetical protein
VVNLVELNSMPAKSEKQYKFMQAMAHGAKSHKGVGPSPEVAKEFIKKTAASKRKQWSKKPGGVDY